MTAFSELMKLHHIGIACESINTGIKDVRKIYDVVNISEVVYDERQKASLCLIETRNGLNIELVSGEQVKSLLAKEISYYHVCYTVLDIHKEIGRLKKQGAIVVSEPKPAILFNNRQVAFLYTNIGLIELLEFDGE